MILSSHIGSVNKINNSCHAKKFSFSGNKSEPSSKDKDYYTYNNGVITSNDEIIAAGAFVGLSALFSGGFSKIFEKLTKKKPSRWISIFEGAAIAFLTVYAALNLVVKRRTTQLTPISEEEQIEKEKKVRALVEDLAKQKGVQLNGFCFYDYRKTGKDTFTLGGFDPSTGYMILTSKFKDTDLDTKEAIPLIVHELTHAQQFANIARLKDGLYDLSRIEVITEVKKLKDDEKKEILSANDEGLLALANKRIHDPKDFVLVNEELDLKNEINMIKAMKTYLNNPNVSKYDLPMIFNEDYYERINEGKGPLSPEEIKKVKSYLNYREKSISINAKEGELGKSIETTVNYYNDPMEKEAYKAQYDYMKTVKTA